jgi:hypothetical protein
MQFHESLAAIYTRRKPSRIHYSGAEALLPLSKLKDGEKVQSAHITRFMASAEVPSATREGRPVPPTAFRWLYNSDYGSVPLNLGAALDIFGRIPCRLAVFVPGKQCSRQHSTVRGRVKDMAPVD